MPPAIDWAASASAKKRDCCRYPRTSQTPDHIRHTKRSLHCCLLPRTFGNRQPVSPLSGTSDRYISASQLLMLMQTPPSPPKTNTAWTALGIRNRFSKPRTYLPEWPLWARRRRYRIGCRRSRGGPLTQTQSPTKSFKPQSTSKTCPSPAILLVHRNPPLLLLTHSTLPIQIHAIVVFQVVIVNPSSTQGRTPTNSPA